MELRKTRTSKSALVVFDYLTCCNAIHAIASSLFGRGVLFTVHTVKDHNTKINCTAFRFACSKQAYMFTQQYASFIKAYVNSNKRATCLLYAHNADTVKMLLTED